MTWISPFRLDLDSGKMLAWTQDTDIWHPVLDTSESIPNTLPHITSKTGMSVAWYHDHAVYYAVIDQNWVINSDPLQSRKVRFSSLVSHPYPSEDVQDLLLYFSAMETHVFILTVHNTDSGKFEVWDLTQNKIFGGSSFICCDAEVFPHPVDNSCAVLCKYYAGSPISTKFYAVRFWGDYVNLTMLPIGPDKGKLSWGIDGMHCVCYSGQGLSLYTWPSMECKAKWVFPGDELRYCHMLRDDDQPVIAAVCMLKTGKFTLYTMPHDLPEVALEIVELPYQLLPPRTATPERRSEEPPRAADTVNITFDSLCHVFAFLDSITIGRISAVSRFFSSVACRESYWRDLCLRQSPLLLILKADLYPTLSWKQFYSKRMECLRHHSVLIGYSLNSLMIPM